MRKKNAEGDMDRTSIAIEALSPDPFCNVQINAGRRLRLLRKRCGLTMRAVRAASVQIAKEQQNRRFVITLRRLSYIEAKNMVPSIHHLYSLALIYGYDIGEFLSWYGLDLARARLSRPSEPALYG